MNLSAIVLAAAFLSPRAAAEEVKTLRIGFFPNITHAQAILGVTQGRFQKALGATKVENKLFNAGPSLTEALSAGAIDIGYVGPGPATNFFVRSQGQGIRVISGAAANGVVIVARKDAGIKTLADLKGRKLATPQLGNTQDIAARFYLKDRFGQKDFSNVLPIPNSEQAGMMLRGQLDASWAPEPWGARLVSEAEGVILAEEKDLWPGKKFCAVVVVTTPEFLAKNPRTVEKFLAEHRALTAELAKDPGSRADEVASGISKISGKQILGSSIKDGLARVLFTTDPLEASMKTMAKWAFELKHLPEETTLEGLIDPSALKPAKAESKAKPKGKGK